MNQLFEFGEYWKTSTMIMFLFIGIIVCLLGKMGAKKRKGNNLVQWAGIYSNVKHIRINWPYILMFLLLLFVFTFRSENTGADTIEYVKIFKASTQLVEFNNLLDTFNYYEPLFLLVNYLVRLITENYTVYFFVCGCIISYSYVRFIYTFWDAKKNHLFLVIFAAAFHYDLNVLRSALATSFVLLSLCSIYEKRYFKSVMLIMIGILFHYTAIINIPLPIFYYLIEKKEKISKKKTVVLLFIGMLILFVIVPKLSGILSFTRYQSYLGNMNTVNILGLWNIIATIGLAILMFHSKKIKTRRGNCLVVFALYNIVPLILNINLGMYRVTGFYLMPRISLWDEKISEYKGSNRLIVNGISLILVLIILLFKMSRYSSNPGFAYEFVWSEL